VVGRFAIETQQPDEEIHIGGAVTTKPKKGMYLKLTKVELQEKKNGDAH
jgi:hypothetical protein